MDEPTASLTHKEINNLFQVIKKLKSKGVGIIYISHRLEEIFEVGDRVAILRDGKCVGSYLMKDIDKDELIKLMVGRELAKEYHHNTADKGKAILRIENLGSDKINNVSFSLMEGEVLGIAGLVGAGRSELVHAIFGADKRTSGKIFINGQEVKINTPVDAFKSGITRCVCPSAWSISTTSSPISPKRWMLPAGPRRRQNNVSIQYPGQHPGPAAWPVQAYGTISGQTE